MSGVARAHVVFRSVHEAFETPSFKKWSLIPSP